LRESLTLELYSLPTSDSGQGQGIFLYSKASENALGPTQTPIQRVLVALYLG